MDAPGAVPLPATPGRGALDDLRFELKEGDVYEQHLASRIEDGLDAQTEAWHAYLREQAESVTLPRAELDQLLAVATMYVQAFEPDELMSLPGKLLLQDIEAILGKYGRRY